jgi:hypothetical protein
MRRSIARLVALVGAFALLSGGDCAGDLFGPIDEPGRIEVTNRSTSEHAVVEVVADDVQAYADLAPGAQTSIHTLAGGDYRVRVVLSGADTDRYRQVLTDATHYVELVHAGQASVPERASAFGWLTQLDDAIASVEDDEAPSCDGMITLDPNTAQTVTATITRNSAADPWELVCESN